MDLRDFFIRYPRAAVAFSGGVDSAYLLYAAKKYAEEVQPYYVKSEFQPGFELADAKRLASELDMEIKVLDVDVITLENIGANPPDRCYYCKKAIFTSIINAAKDDGFEILLDGTNASDEAGDRPGMRALRELSVLSPLRECGLTKEEIRRRSREAGLFTWNKPAYACLATRIPAGEHITREKLKAVEEAEKYMSSLGFTDFRVRSWDGNARIQLHEDQMAGLLEHRQEIVERLKIYFKTVSLDLEVRG